MTDQKVILVTGTSSGFGAMTVRALADAKHVVYAGMRDVTGSDAAAANLARAYAADHTVTLRPVQMDVTDQASVDGAVQAVLDESGHIDVLIHIAAHMVPGPTEAFTPEQVAGVYDVNVLSTQRVNRAVLPHLRAQRDGLALSIKAPLAKNASRVGRTHYGEASSATAMAPGSSREHSPQTRRPFMSLRRPYRLGRTRASRSPNLRNVRFSCATSSLVSA
jgi:NAD(P)-dependent dehydrogenase (short-subunit alcohol dehydrogenase family)